MLTPSQVVSYVKMKLGYPHTPLEYSDDEILNYCRTVTIPEFSKWVPDVKELPLDLSDPSVGTEKPNEFKIVDPDGRPILNVVDVIFDQSNLIMSGFPILGTMGSDEDTILDYNLQTFRGGMARKTSMFNYYYEFIKPNILRITPTPSKGPILVVYERYHLEDFSTIPPEFTTYFLDLCFADVALWLCRTRSIFRMFNTPFGDIELNIEDLRTEAQDLRSRLLEELKTANPSIIVDSG